MNANAGHQEVKRPAKLLFRNYDHCQTTLYILK